MQPRTSLQKVSKHVVGASVNRGAFQSFGDATRVERESMEAVNCRSRLMERPLYVVGNVARMPLGSGTRTVRCPEGRITSSTNRRGH